MKLLPTDSDVRVSASMQRRAVVVSLAAGPLVAPRRVSGQAAAKVPRIGFLSAAFSTTAPSVVKAFNDGLREHGWIEGTNVIVERRFAELDLSRLPALAAELVRLKVELIVAAGSNEVIEPLREVTSTIPIVCTVAINLVELGWIQSLRRPGGNLTGLMWEQSVESGGKYPELLREIVPGLSKMGGLIVPALRGIELLRAKARRQRASSASPCITPRSVRRTTSRVPSPALHRVVCRPFSFTALISSIRTWLASPRWQPNIDSLTCTSSRKRSCRAASCRTA